MNEILYCPLIKENCKQADCMLYCGETGECVFNEIDDNLDNLHSIAVSLMKFRHWIDKQDR